jgi:hypothetical protein
MAYEKTVQRVQQALVTTFDQLDTYFEVDADLRQVHPAENEWCIDEILEHITLTSHFLMITLKQSLDKVLRRAETQAIMDGESDLTRIDRIGDPDAFAWIRPEHMEPTRAVSSEEVRHRMNAQKEEYLAILAQIQHGEGSLHQVRMSVQALGKLDMYEWMYFLIQHAYRHTVEIERILQTARQKQ